ncbi:MAG: hypothetical protein AB8G22_05560, partial [Saprospiraceae bacterium]
MGRIVQSENNSQSFSQMFRFNMTLWSIGVFAVLALAALITTSFTHPNEPTDRTDTANFMSNNELLPQDDWSFSCGDNRAVELVGKGIKNAVPARLDFDNAANIFQVVVEVVYKGGNPGNSITLSDSDGNTYNAPRTTPVGGSSNVFVYRAQLPSTSAVILNNESQENRAQSILAYVYRNNAEGMSSTGQFTYVSGFHDTQTINLSLPAASAARDVEVVVPLSEITEDCRVLNITATAGSVTETIRIDAPDEALGLCCLNIVKIPLQNVPAGVNNVTVEVESPNAPDSGCPSGLNHNGQSYVIAGAIMANQMCADNSNPPDDWSYDCESDECVDILGKGIKNNLPTTINVSAAGSVSQIVAEASYDNTGGGMPPYVTFTLANGSQKTVAPTALTNDPNRFVFRTLLNASNSVTISQPTGYSESVAEAFTLHVYKNAGCAGIGSVGQTVNRFLSGGEYTYTLTVPSNPAPRDIVVTVPLAGLRAAGGRVFVNASAGSVAVDQDIRSFNQGNSLNITPIVLEDVPGNETTVFVKVTAPVGKQRVFLSSASAKVECFDCADPGISLPNEVCAFNTAVFFAEDLGYAGLTYEWDFGPNATPQTATGTGPIFVIFTQVGTENVTLSINNNGECINSITEQITVEDCDETECGLDDVTSSESDCYIANGSLILEVCESCGTTYPITVYYTFQGQEVNAGTFNNDGEIITDLAPGVYTNIYAVDADGCQTNMIDDVVLDSADENGGNSTEVCESSDCTFFGVQDKYGRRSFWIPGLPVLDGVNFEWDSNGGNLEKLGNGTARLTGRIVNLDDNSCGFNVDILFTNESDWNSWSSQQTVPAGSNRSWFGDPALVGTNYENWTYYEIDPSSTLSAFGCLNGTLNLTHNPADFKVGVQIGEGATLFNTLPGLSFWFRYNGTLNGQNFSGEGDVNAEGGCDGGDNDIPVMTCPPCVIVNCEDDLDPDNNPVIGEPIVNCNNAETYTLTYEDTRDGVCPVIVTRTWTATNGTKTATCIQEITLEDNEAPVFVTTSLPPATITVECDVVPAPADPQATDNCNHEIAFEETDTQGSDCNAYNYTITRTWTVSDDCNNSNVFTQVITVEDTTAPEIDTEASNRTVQCDGAGNVTELQDWLNSNGGATASDNCANFEWTYSDPTLSDDCGETGTVTVTFTVTDECGNPSSTTATFTIFDDTDPEFTVPQDVTISCEDNENDLTLTGDVTDESDVCDNNIGEANYTDEVIFGADDPNDDICEGESRITRTWRLVDECDNVTTKDQIIYKEDKVPPTFTVPANITINCEQNPLDLTLVGDVTDEADTCDPAIDEARFTDVVSSDDPCPGASIITRTWVLTDNCGNATTKTQTITLEDVTPPVVTCPSNVTVECSDELDPELNGDLGLPTITDNCTPTDDLVATYVDDLSGLTDCGGNTGTIIRTWTVTDECTNATTCTQVITVIDTTPPVVTCPPATVTIECSDSRDPDTNPNLDRPTFTDNCSEPTDITSTFVDDESGLTGCAGTGVLIRTWTITDECSNISTCVQTITIEDTTDPIVTCPAEVTVECSDDLNPYDNSDLGLPTVSDNCSAVENIELDYADDLTNLTECGGNTGYILRTWTITDECKNVSTCVQTINLIDTTPPVVTCPPANVTIECSDSRDPDENTNLSRPTFTDNCSEVGDIVVNFTDDESGLSGCAETGVLIRTWTVTDECDNTSTCVQTITIQDTTNPVITCPNEVTVECSDDLNPYNNTALGVPTVSDNCSAEANIALTYTDDESNLTECGGNTGYILRTWTATDECDNFTTCVQTINLIDTTPPVVTCPPANVTIECSDSRDPDANPNLDRPTFTDNCSDVGTITATFVDDESGLTACGGTGLLVRTWTITDECTNTSTCVQNITIIDTTAPEIVCPNEVTIECDASTDPYTNGDLGIPTVSDNCDEENELTVTYTDDLSGLTDCGGNQGVIIRTWQVVDLCNNSTTCTQTINIQDTTRPEVTCPPSEVTIECSDSRDPSNPDLGEPTFTDNCSDNADIVVNYTDDESGLTGCAGTGTLIRTWTITDECNNETVCTQTITIEDTTDPIVTCPEDLTIECSDDRDPYTNTGLGTPTVSDNCTEVGDLTVAYVDDESGLTDCGGNAGFIIRTWTVTDECLNATTCTQRINVIDSTPPVVTCPPTTVTLECDDSRDPSNPDLGEPTFTDNCSDENNITSTYVDDESGLTGCNNTGILIRTWTITDECNNSTLCTQTITIEDTTDPIVTCPTDVTIECSDDRNPYNNGNLGLPAVDDNCTDVNDLTVTYSDDESNLTECGGNEGYIIRTWTIVDQCNNTTTCDQRITIIDTTPPVVTCPPSTVTIECSDSRDPSNPDLGEPTFTDNCSDNTNIVVNYIDDESGLTGCANTGILIRTWTVTDECDNTSTCVQNITIEDTTAPVVTCPNDVTIECSDDLDPDVNTNLGEPTATDNCSDVGDLVATYVDDESGLIDCGGNAGFIIRTWTVTDECTNATTCTQRINVIDSTPPVVTCPPTTVTLECDDSRDPSNPDLGEPTFTDNCSDENNIT